MPPAYSDNLTEDLWYKRPVKVGVISITTSTTVNTSQDFIAAWLNDPMVNRKLKNVRLIRPIFRVRVHVNSNPTVYGPIMVVPAYNGTESQVDFMNGRSVDSAIITSCGVNEVEFTIPWTFPFDYYTLNNGGLTINRSFDEIGTTGDKNGKLPKLKLISPVALRTVSAAFPGVAIVTTVWCESLETAQLYQPQSGTDEYSKPNISKTATALANEVDKVNVPILKPFTTATSMALRIGSGIASIFGFSRPLNIETQVPYINTKYGDSFSLNSTRYGRRLCDDIKQELSLTDYTAGPSESIDELSFDALCSKWTTVLSTDLAMGSTPGQFISFPVTPCITGITGISGFYHCTTLSATALMFRYWRGDMHYKIRVDSTVYHSGVLQILWTPEISNTNIDLTNVTQQFLFDINGTKEVDFIIPYSFVQPFLKTKMFQVGTPRAQWSASNAFQCFHGRIEINYWTPIAGANNVYVHVWAKGENMDFDTQSDFCDKARYNNLGAAETLNGMVATPIAPVQLINATIGVDGNGYIPQSGNDPTPVPPGSSSLEGSASLHVGAPIILGPRKSVDHTSNVVTGQKLRSLRPYLKRNMPYIRWTSVTASTGVALAIVRMGLDLPGAILPPSRYLNIAASASTNYVEGNMLNILSTAFMGWRGAIRYHVSPTGLDEASVIVSNHLGNAIATSLFLPSVSSFANEQLLTEFRGQFSSYNRGVQHFGREEELSFEIPYRWKQNWVATTSRAATTNAGPTPPDTSIVPIATVLYSTIGTSKIMVDQSIGEDFNYFIRTVMNPICIRNNTTKTSKIELIPYP